jgi:rhodanese-related sulfurtransferase
MSLRPWRIVVVLVAGAACGLAWNAWSGRGVALGQSAFLHPGEETETVTVAEARERLARGALFLDARPFDFYELGHVPGALSLPEEEFEAAAARLEPELRRRPDIVVYCSGEGCEASHIVARRLRGRGIAAAVLQDGWPAWEKAGLAIRSGPAP